MHRFMVKSEPANIFKGILETRKSAKNGKRFAKSGVRETWDSRVYHARINHEAACTRLHCPLTRPLAQTRRSRRLGPSLFRSGFDISIHHGNEQAAQHLLLRGANPARLGGFRTAFAGGKARASGRRNRKRPRRHAAQGFGGRHHGRSSRTPDRRLTAAFRDCPPPAAAPAEAHRSTAGRSPPRNASQLPPVPLGVIALRLLDRLAGLARLAIARDLAVPLILIALQKPSAQLRQLVRRKFGNCLFQLLNRHARAPSSFAP